MRWISVPGLIFVAAMAFGQTPAPAAAVIAGSVLDQSKALIPGVQILLNNPGGEVKRTVTDEGGRFSMEAPAGSYVLTAQLPGFESSINVVQLTTIEPVQLHLTLTPKPRTPRLVGTLKRSEPGPPFSGFNGKWKSDQKYQAEFSVAGDNVTGTLSIGGLGGDFHVIRDGKLVGNQFRFQTKATGSTVDSQTGRRITSTAVTTWTVQLVDENTIELRSDLEIDNGIMIGVRN